MEQTTIFTFGGNMNKRILSFLICLVILITALLTASCEKKEPAAVPVLTKVKNV
jgi:hypothetical protein